VNKRFAWVAGVLLALQKAAIGSAIKLQIILYVENWIDICQSFYSSIRWVCACRGCHEKQKIFFGLKFKCVH